MDFYKQEAILDGLKNAAEYFGFPEDFGSPNRSSLASKNETPQKGGKKLTHSNSGTLCLLTIPFNKGYRSSFEFN